MKRANRYYSIAENTKKIDYRQHKLENILPVSISVSNSFNADPNELYTDPNELYTEPNEFNTDQKAFYVVPAPGLPGAGKGSG